MNLEESNKVYQKNKQKNAKKQTILGGIVICIIIMVVCFMAIFYLNAKEEARFKMYVNSQEVPLNDNLQTTDEDGIVYINIKELAKYIGYNYNQGDYVKFDEDKNSCYLENKYEIVTFRADENSFSKYIKNEEIAEVNTEENTQTQSEQTQLNYVVKSEDGTKEDFTTELPVKLINEQLYMPLNIVHLACNTQISITESRMNIFTLDYLVKSMQVLAANNGYEVISSTYENLRAILNNMLVVGKNNQYGVISLETGKTILSVKYDDIKYIQNENRFYVYIDSKVGILDAEANTIISPTEYEDIKIFDEEKKLFLVKKAGKYGLLNSNAETVLHTDFDAIGINDIDDYNTENFTNKNIWFDNIVAVKKGDKYGLYNIDTSNPISNFDYDGFGYKTKTTDKSGEESLLIVPEETGVEGIVVNINGLYGIYDINLKGQVIPCSCSRIYSITNNGVSTYYMEFNGTQLEMKKYFEDHNMVTAR